jgi:hypothetical protein
MLEPRIVAVRIHGLILSAQGTSLLPERSTASSQGALIETMDAIQDALGPKIDPAGFRHFVRWQRIRLPSRQGATVVSVLRLAVLSTGIVTWIWDWLFAIVRVVP